MSERDDELLLDLFCAVADRDLDRAIAALKTIRTVSHSEPRRELALQALRRMENLPKPADVRPIPLPQPGADPRTVFGGPGERLHYIGKKRRSRA